MDGRHVVEGPAVALYVLDHKVVLTAHQVLDADLLASFQLTTQDVLDPLSRFCLWPEVRGGVAVHFLPSVRSLQYLPSPAPVLAVRALDSMSRSLPMNSPGGRGS